MKKLLLILMSIAGTWTAGAAEIHCTACKAKVLLGDQFCPNCGTRTEQSQYWHEVETHESGHALPVPMGMLRGLAEIACSPLEIARGASIAESSLFNSGKNPFEIMFFTVVGVPTAACVLGGIGAALDASFGALDVISFGTLGNAYWNDDRSTPYIFGRYWTTGSHYTKGVWF